MGPLWRAWPEVARRLRGADEVRLFLDFDGTLTPIAAHPRRARCPAAVRQLLRRLARRRDVRIAVISGRAARDVRRMVDVNHVCYVGNHGLEARGRRLRYVNPVAVKARPILRHLRGVLERTIHPFAGAWVEDKTLTLTVHYRGTPDRQRAALCRRILAALRPQQAARQIRVTEGKFVVEIRPPVRWGKGTIVRWLMARWPGGLPIYVGDDVTDEEAFRVLRRDGLTIAVGPVTAATQACYAVRSTRDVQRLLRQLLAVRAARGHRDAG